MYHFVYLSQYHSFIHSFIRRTNAQTTQKINSNNSFTWFGVICSRLRLHFYASYVKTIGVVNEWLIQDAWNQQHKKLGSEFMGHLVNHLFVYFHSSSWVLCCFLFKFSQGSIDAPCLLTVRLDVWLYTALLYPHIITQVCNIQPHMHKKINI